MGTEFDGRFNGEELMSGNDETSNTPQPPDVPKKRIVLPMVPSEAPGTLPMTAERVAELLEEADDATFVDILPPES
jgi:hypothetical protein